MLNKMIVSELHTRNEYKRSMTYKKININT
jgi:hypothetical protein